MSRGKQSLNLKKVVKWVIIVTIIIAAIEIPIVYFYFKNKDKTAAVQSKPRQTVEAESTTITNQSTTETLPPIVVENLTRQEAEPLLTPTIPTDTVSKMPAPIVVKEKPVTAPPAKKVDSAQASTPKPLLVKKILTSYQMQDVVDQVNAKRAQSGSAMKCVKIRQTASSNVSNGFKLADALKSNGYIISGRETVTNKVKGILVTGGNDCMVVTVGSL